LRARSPAAAATETSAVRRCGLTAGMKQKNPPERVPLRWAAPPGSYVLAMSPMNFSFSIVPAPLPLSCQCLYFSFANADACLAGEV